MSLGLPDPHPDPLVTSTDLAPDPDPSSKKNLDFYCLRLLYDFLPVFRIRIRTEMSRIHNTARKEAILDRKRSTFIRTLFRRHYTSMH
jgi:hypothetical protein